MYIEYLDLKKNFDPVVQSFFKIFVVNVINEGLKAYSVMFF